MPDIKVPFGFETQVSTDFGDTHDYRSVKGFKADVMLNHVQVFTRHYRVKDMVAATWLNDHPRPPAKDADALRQWYRDFGDITKDTANDEEDAADQVLTAFAHRLALTLTWPDGA